MKNKCFTFVFSLRFRRPPVRKSALENGPVLLAVKEMLFSLLVLAGTANFTEVVAQTTFGPQQVIIEPELEGVQEVFAADLDNDGDLDVLSASSGDGKIAWYENDGSGGFGPQQVITTNADGAQSVYAADLDNDGDQDVLSASSVYDPMDSKIAWYENDGAGNFGPQQLITLDAGAHTVFAADLDNDGDMDVLSASTVYNPIEGKIAWYKNDGSGNFGPQQVITTVAEYAVVYPADLDNDGDQDVLAASYSDGIIWYENDGSGNFGLPQVINTHADGAGSVYAADLDNDGDQDVLAASYSDGIIWYENDGNGNLGAKQTITTEVMHAASVHAADLDNDGDMDVLSASSGDGKIAWYENLWSLVGVEDFKKPDAWFTLFPNPSSSQTYIQMEPEALQGNTIGLRITDAQGRWVLAKAALNAGSFPFALPQVPDGIYFVTLISGKTSQTLKWAVMSN